jgi:hypothetical protein
MTNLELIQAVNNTIPAGDTLEEISFEAETVLIKMASGKYVTWRFMKESENAVSLYWPSELISERYNALKDFMVRVSERSVTLKDLI